ncbi:MAG: hypothetical protein K8M05_25660 [Deltaproteobacteria bacterium]|nr:hypothetical protein [Kofleriaceae bacterium]
MRVLLASLGLLAGAAGCQTFIGIEDAQQHLPRLEGNYLVAIERARPSDPATIDQIRLTGTASLDLDSRTLDLSLSILPFGGGTPLSETTIGGIEFPDDSDEVEYVINISVPAGALNPTPAPQPMDFQVNERVRMIAEADYSFCAKPEPTPVPPTVVPRMGSIFVESFGTLPPMADPSCDDPMRE